MDEKEKQLERFCEAVEEKKAEARARSEQPGPDSSSRNDKVTADKWNQ